MLAGLLAYSNSYNGPFIYDDTLAVVHNASIRQWWDIGQILQPPSSLTVGGRPVLNLSFALNYAISGKSVWSYHVFNLLIHLLAGLTLFDLLRRTLQQPIFHQRYSGTAVPLAGAMALLWTVHPIQTESVTYISQRAESMMGLFYLLTLYCFVRYSEVSSRHRLWMTLGIISCFLGMATKEVMVTAPLMVLLYDRTFVAGTFLAALRQHGRFYLGLAVTWGFLAYSLPSVDQRSVGTSLGVSMHDYALTECRAIVHYIALTVWPHPLVLDYGPVFIHDPLQVWPQILILLFFFVVTVVALVRWPVIGFISAWFFVILAPTSSIIPVALSPEAEHRLYLPLVSMVTLVVAGIYTLMRSRSWPIIAALIILAGSLTFLRNFDYVTALRIWSDTLAKVPHNARVRTSYGATLMEEGRIYEAIIQHNIAIQEDPKLAEAFYNLGTADNKLGLAWPAIINYRQAIALKPTLADAHYNLGRALIETNQFPLAIDEFQWALHYNPGDVSALNLLAMSLYSMGRRDEAVLCLREAIRLQPDSVESHNNLGIVLEGIGQRPEARQEFEKALQLNPNYIQAQNNLKIQSATPPVKPLPPESPTLLPTPAQ